MYQFYAREHLEIVHLSRTLISNEIAQRAATILDVTPAELLPSENLGAGGRTSHTHKYGRSFSWLVFFVIPLLFTALLVYWRNPQFSRFRALSSLTKSEAMIALVAAGRVLVLLRRHRI